MIEAETRRGVKAFFCDKHCRSRWIGKNCDVSMKIGAHRKHDWDTVLKLKAEGKTYRQIEALVGVPMGASIAIVHRTRKRELQKGGI